MLAYELLRDGVLLPAAAAAGVPALLYLPFRRAAFGRPLGSAALALGVAGGFALAAERVGGGFALPPRDTAHWLVLLASAAAVFVPVVEERPSARRPRATLRLLFAAVSAVTVLEPLLSREGPQSPSFALVAALVLGIFLLWSAAEIASRLLVSALPLWVFAAAAGATAPVLALGGSARYGQLAGAAAAALASAALIGGWLRPFGLTAALRAGGILLAGLWVAGRAYADVPLAPLLLLGGGAGAGCAALTAWGAAAAPRRRLILALGPVLLAAAAALLVAWAGRETSPYPY